MNSSELDRQETGALALVVAYFIVSYLTDYLGCLIGDELDGGRRMEEKGRGIRWRRRKIAYGDS